MNEHEKNPGDTNSIRADSVQADSVQTDHLRETEELTQCGHTAASRVCDDHEGKITFRKAVGHFKTITHHHNLVCQYCLRAGLVRQGLTHDLSKYSPTEFLVGARYWQAGKRSPNNAEREATGVSTSWLHHKGRNKHHFEYWIDYSPDLKDPHVLAGMRMPRRYVAEMIFDRVSASRVYMGENYTDEMPLRYYLRSKERSWFIHPETKRDMEFLLRMWAKKGERYTIAFIRKVYIPKGLPERGSGHIRSDGSRAGKD